MSISLSCLKTHGINLSMSAGLLTVFAGPSMPFGRWEDFGIREEGALQLPQTRAELSLGVCTCPIPKCENHSGSVPHLLFLSAAPGVLATPHLLSHTRRGASEARPLEDGSCTPRWPSSPTMNYSYRKRGKCRECPPPPLYLFLSISCLFSFLNHETGNRNLHLRNHVKTAVWWMWDLASLPNVILRFMAVYRS